MRAALLLMLLLQYASAIGQSADLRPLGHNCNLATPPASAGEEMNHGITLRIYPRARDIGDNYTGCQVTWLSQKGMWFVVSMVEIRAGQPMRVWSAESPHPMADPCTYRNGKLVKGNPNTCPEPKFLITKSLPAGCTAKIAQSVERDGITAPWPPGCQYE